MGRVIGGDVQPNRILSIARWWHAVMLARLDSDHISRNITTQIRLKVEHTGFPQVAPRRFGQRFCGEDPNDWLVANPFELLQCVPLTLSNALL